MMSTALRQKSLIIPREHGAWGILLVSLVTGAGVGLAAGGSGSSLAPLTVAVLTLFWLRTPVESWMGTTPIRARAPAEIQLVRKAVLGLTAISTVALIWLFCVGRNSVLLWIGAAAGAAFLLQALVRHSARTAAQMIGAAGLTATAPAAFCAATGAWGKAAWTLWGLNLLFAINQIHFVQLQIRAAHVKTRNEKLAAGGGFLAGQVALIGLLGAACATSLIPWYTTLAFIPILMRGFVSFAAPRPLAVRRLGKTELAHACLFGVLLMAGMARRQFGGRLQWLTIPTPANRRRIAQPDAARGPLRFKRVFWEIGQSKPPSPKGEGL